MLSTAVRWTYLASLGSPFSSTTYMSSIGYISSSLPCPGQYRAAGSQIVLYTHVNQEELRARLRQRAVIEQRELVGFLLECLLIGAVAELIRQGAAETIQVRSATRTGERLCLANPRVYT